jgi:hypothetical protein
MNLRTFSASAIFFSASVCLLPFTRLIVRGRAFRNDSGNPSGIMMMDWLLKPSLPARPLSCAKLRN